MKSCRTASVVAMIPLSGVLAFAACHEQTRVDVPPVTVATPDAALPFEVEAPVAIADAATDAGPTPPVTAMVVQAPAKIGDGLCMRTILAVTNGKLTVGPDTLEPGDTLVELHATAQEITGTGFGVLVNAPLSEVCAVLSRPPMARTIVRGKDTPKLEWAKGAMNARLDVSTKLSPEVYVGRLEGTAAVAEHAHAGSWEILAAIDAKGTFVVNGRESRLRPGEIVFVPPNTKHQWKPDPGSKLLAVQMYAPPGPEQRFVALAAADKDAGAPVK